jgi:thiamine biosynthesis lipoprotein
MTALAVKAEAGSPGYAVRRWQALGTYVHLSTDRPESGDRAEALARQVIETVDRTCSRFLPDSDLSRVNAAAGEWVAVDPFFTSALTIALEAATATDGLVNPCLGRQLVELGYDQTFSAVLARGAARTPERASNNYDANAWREVDVDPTGAVRVPSGCALDLGATAKAWASDLVAATIADELGGRVLVSLGGDISIAGEDGVHWPVTISERPGEPAEATVLLTGGGLATSSTRVRRWPSGDDHRHHLLDPRTGQPVDELWRTVSATGPTCVAANVATTAAIVLRADAVEWLSDRGVAARLVDTHGRVTTVAGWPLDSASEATMGDR